MQLSILEFIKQPWPWYVAGPLIGICVPLLLLAGNKPLGISSSLRDICAATVPANLPFLKYDLRSRTWNIYFVLGLLASGFIGENWFSSTENIAIADSTVSMLKNYGISDQNNFLPAEVFNLKALFSYPGFILIIVGGFLVGFGTRWAGGCTSGHGIYGLSALQLPSLIATLFFFAFGIITSWFILPVLLSINH